MNKMDVIEKLSLIPHPEGGYYGETYRSELLVDPGSSFSGKRHVATCIYFLLSTGDVSKLHRIKSDEIWYHHEGDPVEVVWVDDEGGMQSQVCGPLSLDYDPQVIVKKDTLFGARLTCGNEKSAGYGLVSCSVSPGFSFDDFHMPGLNEIRGEFPNLDKDLVSFIKTEDQV